MESILHYADYSKAKEVEVHQQNEFCSYMGASDTDRDLIFTSFTQKNYMVQFFERRHLI